MPRFTMPEVVGVAMSQRDIANIVQKSIQDMADGLGFSRMAALSYVPTEAMLRGVSTAGYEDENIRSLYIPVADFPIAERAIRTREIQIIAGDSNGLPDYLSSALTGDIAITPLILGDRVLAVLVGQLKQGLPVGSSQWREHITEVSGRAALMVELERIAAAYQDELRLRLANRAVAAAMLEGRPLSEIAELITEFISQRLREDRIALFLRDENGNSKPVVLRNVSKDYGEAITRLPRTNGYLTRAFSTGLPYYVREVQVNEKISPDLRALFVSEGITSFLVSQLQHEDTVRGLLVLFPERQREFTPVEMAVFQSFSDLSTLAVLMTQQFEQLRDMATSEERHRLAREMHDTVAQALTAVVMQVETAQTCLESGDIDTVRNMLDSASIQTRKALDDTRRAVQGLSPPTLERLTLAETIALETAQFAESEGIETPFIQNGEEHPLSSEQRLALLRISQEALNNARKHARARRVRVGLQYNPDNVVLIVEDDGVGFDNTHRETSDTTGGYGLFGMNERARLLGGEVQIQSTPNWGTRIQVLLPYQLAASSVEIVTAHPNIDAQLNENERSINSNIVSTDSELIRIIIADDHQVVRQGIRMTLETDPQNQVIAEASNGEEAIALAKQHRPDVIMLDIQMPIMDGIETLRRLQTELPELPVIILTTFPEERLITEALSAGAKGFLLKDARAADLLAGVRAAHRGEALLSPAVTRHIAALTSRQPSRSENENGPTINERERDVLLLISQGARNKEIATQLQITVSTVEKHVANIFNKLTVSNRAEAVRTAIDFGLLPKDGRSLK